MDDVIVGLERAHLADPFDYVALQDYAQALERSDRHLQTQTYKQAILELRAPHIPVEQRLDKARKLGFLALPPLLASVTSTDQAAGRHDALLILSGLGPAARLALLPLLPFLGRFRQSDDDQLIDCLVEIAQETPDRLRIAAALSKSRSNINKAQSSALAILESLPEEEVISITPIVLAMIDSVYIPIAERASALTHKLSKDQKGFEQGLIKALVSPSEGIARKAAAFLRVYNPSKQAIPALKQRLASLSETDLDQAKTRLDIAGVLLVLGEAKGRALIVTGINHEQAEIRRRAIQIAWGSEGAPKHRPPREFNTLTKLLNSLGIRGFSLGIAVLIGVAFATLSLAYQLAPRPIILVSLTPIALVSLVIAVGSFTDRS